MYLVRVIYHFTIRNVSEGRNLIVIQLRHLSACLRVPNEKALLLLLPFPSELLMVQHLNNGTSRSFFL